MRVKHMLGAGIAALLVAFDALAHVTSTGIATVAVEGDRVTVRLSLSLGELPQEPAQLIARAAEGEAASAERVADALRAQVKVARGSEACRPGRVRIQGSRLEDGRAILQLVFTCPKAGGKIEYADQLQLAFGEHYRTIASIDQSGLSAQGWPEFLALGVEHILTGYDHLMFLAALVIGSRGLWRTIGIVTAFTVAHSVTLALASLGIAAVPAAVIEPAIAASICWIALENLYSPAACFRRWVIGFLFGLVHGFGFASALEGIELRGWAFARALIAFNLGVEIGQAAAVLAAAALLARLGEGAGPARLRRALSTLLALAGGVWFAARVATG